VFANVSSDQSSASGIDGALVISGVFYRKISAAMLASPPTIRPLNRFAKQTPDRRYRSIRHHVLMERPCEVGIFVENVTRSLCGAEFRGEVIGADNDSTQSYAVSISSRC